MVTLDYDKNGAPKCDFSLFFIITYNPVDGNYLAVTISDASRRTDIWIYEIERGTLTPLTFGNTGGHPVWSLDGRRVTYRSYEKDAIMSVPFDGGSEPEELVKSSVRQVPASWSPDGALVFQAGSSSSLQDIWVLSSDGSVEADPFLVTGFNEKHPAFSPDGKWIALSSNRSGRQEVYVKPFPGEGGIATVSTEGGDEPRWARNGRELFYRNGDKLMVVPIQTEPTFRAGSPRVLFEGRFTDSWVDLTPNYDVTPDGLQMVMVRSYRAGNLNQINVVLNWFEELKRLVPTE